jgi:hypothetical protein
MEARAHVPNRIDAPMDPMQAARLYPTSNRALVEVCGMKLLDRYDSVLPRRCLSYPPIP